MKRTIVLAALAGLLGPASTAADVPDALVTKAAPETARTGPVRRAAVTLTSNDRTLVLAVEDALAIHLTKAGIEAPGREEIERIARQNKARDDVLDRAVAARCDVLITGTVLISASRSDEVVVKLASLQVLDLPTGRPLMRWLMESSSGGRFRDVAEMFVAEMTRQLPTPKPRLSGGELAPGRKSGRE